MKQPRPRLYPKARERLFSGLGAAPPYASEALPLDVVQRAPAPDKRRNCSSTRAKYDWAAVEVCASPTNYRGPNIRHSGDAVGVAVRAASLDARVNEHVLILAVDAKNKPMGVVVTNKGGVSSSMVDTSTILQAVLLLGAPAFFMFHNHPAGDPQPSREDMDVTLAMRAAARTVGLRMMDHIIVGMQIDPARDADVKYYSFVDHGL